MKIVIKLSKMLKRILLLIFSFHWLAWFLSFFMPINKKKIVVSCNDGKGYSDSPKYIIEKLLSSNNHLKIIWLVNDTNEKKTLPDGVFACKNDTFKSIINLSTAGIWIDNSRKKFLHKKKRQLYIQTWHGGGATKRVEKEVEEKLPIEYVKLAKKDSKAIDIFLSDSKFQTKNIFKSYWYNGYVFEVGSPRYDILINGSHEKIKKEVYNYFKIDCSKKVILYAPTFRANGELEPYSIDFERLRNSCKERFGGEFVVLVRLHPNIASCSSFLNYSDRLINASYYTDMQELLIASDILISDYSSAIFDFCLTNKPSFRFATDVDMYINDRGFYFDVNEYPYPLAQSNDELEYIISSFDENDYKTRITRFLEKLQYVPIYNCSEICSNFIIDYISNNNNLNLIISKYSKYLVMK